MRNTPALTFVLEPAHGTRSHNTGNGPCRVLPAARGCSKHSQALALLIFISMALSGHHYHASCRDTEVQKNETTCQRCEVVKGEGVTQIQAVEPRAGDPHHWSLRGQDDTLISGYSVF